MSNPKLQSALTALANARALVDAAARMERELLHELLYDTREEGLSIRETAAVLRTPKSTVARHRRALDRQQLPPGMGDDPAGAWITPEAYVAANNLVWEHDPSRHISEAGFEVIQSQDSYKRTIVSHPGQTYRP